MTDKDGFSLVIYKKKKKKYRNKTPSNDPYWLVLGGNCITPQPIPENFGDVMKNIQDELKCSDFILHFRKDLFKVLEEWNLLVSPEAFIFVDSPCVSETSPTVSKKCSDIEIICYGLGKFSSSYIARYQLGFLLVLQQILHSVHVYVYDPEFSEYEIDFLKQLGLIVLEFNENCKRKLSKKSVLFMPHCDLPLYSNLLWANWNAKSLSELVIIGNSFESYENNISAKVNDVAKFVSMANKFITEIKMENNFVIHDVFNDTSVHYFKSSSLSLVDPFVWTVSDHPDFTVTDNIIAK